MAANRKAIDAVGKVPSWCIADKRQDHAAERTIGMQVFPGNRQILKDGIDAIDIINSPFHRCADIGANDRRAGAIQAQALAQIIEILCQVNNVTSLQDSSFNWYLLWLFWGYR